MDLILLRHTRPAVAPGICYGQLDLDLAESFPQDAEQVLASLPPCRSIIASPLQRCRQLAEHIASARDLPVQFDPRLQELAFGRWEGIPWDAIPRHEIDAWAADLRHANPYGGESVAQVVQRVAAALSDYQNREAPLLWVVHAGVIRAVMDLYQQGDGLHTHVEYGEWLRVNA